MTKYVVNINLSKGKTPDLDYMFINAIENAMKEIEIKVVLKLQEMMSLYGLGDSTLSSNAKIEYLEDGFSLVMDSEYAMFVEYGTGIIGSDMTHPNASEHGWVYDVNSHGVFGWWYPTVDSDPNPYKWINPSNGMLYAWTAGQASRPFMYHTWLWAKDNVRLIIDKHFGIEMKKLESESR